MEVVQRIREQHKLLGHVVNPTCVAVSIEEGVFAGGSWRAVGVLRNSRDRGRGNDLHTEW